jgi:glycosyltransferase involved in cell wall biosynthesis
MKKRICLSPSALNEAEALDKFLKYHSWADEIIIIDAGSTDGTEDVCRRYGRRIVKTTINGNYNRRSAWSIKQTNADWVFFIDPDEFITPELKAEIDQVLESSEDIYQAYEIRRVNFFMDKPLKYGGWSGHALKFFKREAVSFVGDSYHEKPIIKGKIGCLNGAVLHYPNPNIHWFIQKFNYSSEFDSNEYCERYGVLTQRKFKWLLLKKPLKNFWKCYVKKKGYKDGLHGFIYAALIWAFDVIRICKYGERYIVKNPNIMPTDRLPDPWECRKI